MRTLAIVVLSVTACADPAEDLGTVVYWEAGSTALVAVDVAAGEARELAAPAGTPGELALAPDGGAVAFHRRGAAGWQIGSIELAGGAARALAPAADDHARLGWGSGGWLRYRAPSDGEDLWQLAAPGATAARSLGADRADGLVWSPTEPRLAFSECSAPAEGTCPLQVVVEDAGGGDRRVLATGDWLEPIGFTTDGRELLVHEGAAELAAYEHATGVRRELGAARGLLDAFDQQGLSALSADGRELLVEQDGRVIAVALDGSGRREVFSGDARWAGFTAAGDVVVQESVEVGETDLIEYEHHLYLIRGGATQRLCGPEEDLAVMVASPSGALLAWPCGGHLAVWSTTDGTQVATLPPAAWVLGFDREDRGLVVMRPAGTGFTLSYVDLEGGERELGTAHVADPERLWPPPARHVP